MRLSCDHICFVASLPQINALICVTYCHYRRVDVGKNGHLNGYSRLGSQNSTHNITLNSFDASIFSLCMLESILGYWFGSVMLQINYYSWYFHKKLFNAQQYALRQVFASQRQDWISLGVNLGDAGMTNECLTDFLNADTIQSAIPLELSIWINNSILQNYHVKVTGIVCYSQNSETVCRNS